MPEQVCTRVDVAGIVQVQREQTNVKILKGRPMVINVGFLGSLIHSCRAEAT